MNLCDGSDTVQQSQTASTDTWSSRGIKTRHVLQADSWAKDLTGDGFAKAANVFLTPHLGAWHQRGPKAGMFIKAVIKLTVLSLPLGMERDDAHVRPCCPGVPLLPRVRTQQRSQTQKSTPRCPSKRTPDWHHFKPANQGRGESFDLNLQML